MCWISSESYKNTTFDRGCRGFRLFIACFRFFHVELSLMPDTN